MLSGREQLLAWIARAKLQKGQAAALLGMTASGLSKIIGGTRLPTLPTAVRIEGVTGIPVASWVPHRRGRSVQRRNIQEKTVTLA